MKWRTETYSYDNFAKQTNVQQQCKFDLEDKWIKKKILFIKIDSSSKIIDENMYLGQSCFPRSDN